MEYLRLENLMKKLQIGRNKALEIFKDPQLKAFKIKGIWYVRNDDVDAYIFRQFLKQQEKKFKELNRGKIEIWQTKDKKGIFISE